MMASEDLGQKVKNLLEEIGDLKGRVCDLVVQGHEDFVKSSAAIISLAESSTSLKHSAESVRKSASVDKLPQLMRTTKEHKVLGAQLEQLGMVQDTLENIIQLHKLLHSLEDCLDQGDIWKAVQITSEVRHLLPQLKVRKEDIRVFEALRMTFLELKDRVRYAMEEEWNKAVSWKGDEEGNDACLTLALSPSKMQQLVSSLEVIGEARTKVSKTVQQFVERLVLPYVRGKATLSVKTDAGGIVLTSEKVSTPEAVNPSKLFELLTKVFLEFNRHFLSLTVVERPKVERVIDNTRYMIVDPLLSSIIESCLSQSLPLSQEELKTYSDQVVPQCKRFEGQMQQWEILKTDNHQLSDYVAEIDKLFLEKKREAILIRCRELMKLSLFDITPVGEESCHGDPGSDANVTFFPRCLVSQPLVDIISLLDEAVEELLSSSSDEYKSQVYNAIHDVIEYYPRIVTTVHKDALEGVPQAASIFHCNCMYLAHRCLFDFRLSVVVPRGSFVHLVKYLRTAANDALLAQMRRQRDQLDEIMATVTDFQEAAARSARLLGALRQCCRQMGVLSRVWRVLPKHVFAQVLGTVINHVCHRMIRDVCAIADISTDDCETLLELFKFLRDESLNLYSIPEVEAVPQKYQFADDPAALSIQVTKYVQSWPKVNEIIFVLNSGLMEISERWAGGKGPLAEAFSVSEMKSLIRALFQNTEKRAAVLAKIR